MTYFREIVAFNAEKTYLAVIEVSAAGSHFFLW